MQPPGWFPAPAPECAHGRKLFKSGLSPDGQLWYAWACPDKTEDQCTRAQNGYEFHNPPKGK